jgi:hypothetical protein
MRMNLKVPFVEKDQAKKLGARWDAARKFWYVADAADLSAFLRWSPTPHDGDDAPSVPSSQSAARQSFSGKVFVGSAYVESVRVCDCLPWDVCPVCESSAL